MASMIITPVSDPREAAASAVVIKTKAVVAVGINPM